ncbi:MAG: hypothetical protein ACO1QR_13665 [Chthoniobacteraceae bacterium]
MSTKRQPQHFVESGSTLGAVSTVRTLLVHSPAAFLCAFVPGYHPAWGIGSGVALLISGIIVAWRYRVTFRAIFQRTPHDARKLYSSRVL